MPNRSEFDLQASGIIRQVYAKNSKFWENTQKQNSLALFHLAAKKVPAYKDFLKKQKIAPEKIKTFGDLQAVPPTNKKNYLSQYPLYDLAHNGKLSKQLVYTTTSGSTGKPCYFPRFSRLDWQSSVSHELFLKNGLRRKDESVLVIVGFAMGVWIGGLITYKAFEIAARRGNYNVSIITPGVHKAEILKTLKNLSPLYDRTILAGYPPFIKDVLDEAGQNGLPLKKLNLRLLFAAESFTENFRDYVAEKAGIKNIYLDTMNVYGTADIGTMAHETPAAILIRRLAMKDHGLFRSLFCEIRKTPTLAQYNPHFINFESLGGELLLTGDNALPLVRYALGDNGGVMDFKKIAKKCALAGLDLRAEANKAGILKYLYELPFVYVYERNDFSIKLHLHDIHPEIIRDALIAPKFHSQLTGKFCMATRYNSKNNQYLEVNLEMKKGAKSRKSLAKAVRAKILEALGSKASGPGDIQDFIKRPGLVKINFFKNGDATYFKPGIKQTWTLNHKL